MKRIITSLLLVLILSVQSNAQQKLSNAPPFLTPFTPTAAIITDYAYKDTVNAPFSLVRLPNNKVVYMAKDEGTMKPFFIKAIETGYWDTRYEEDTDYDKVFADMKEIGANTAYVMLHWEDIEPQDNQFDFSFPDKVVQAAANQNLKIKWILFLHAQTDKVPTLKPETAWTFHLDDRDSANYTMQWPKRNGKIYNEIGSLIKDGGIRPLHVYGHPEIFYRIRRMLYNLAVHYRNNSEVIGVQIGNEEGFSFLNESDYNPITASLFEEWKLKTNKTDYALFKKDAIDWWWKQFTSAYHEGDPYKITSFNLDAGQAEAGDKNRVAMTGTSAATYADGNLDAIGTMLYKNWGEKALLGLDNYYGNMYNYRLPILVPSEIGIGVFNTPAYFRRFTAMTLSRAAQGFGVYCYGEVQKELPDKINERKVLTSMFDNIDSNEDIIFPGLPGPGYATVTAKDSTIKVSHLNLNNEKTLALLYDLSGIEITNNDQDNKTADIDISCTVSIPGKYTITISTSTNKKIIEAVISKEKQNYAITVPNFDKTDLLFIKIERISSL